MKDDRPNRVRKTISFPKECAEELQQIANQKYCGDFTRAVLEEMAPRHASVRKFLRFNTTWKFSAKK
jgi:hypothetical protein